MEWTRSGIRNTFEYEMIDPFQLNVSRGMLTGVTSASITEGYETDAKCSAKVELDDTSNWVPYSQVRIWHTATLGSEVYRHRLGTYTFESMDRVYEYGRTKTTLNLISPLDKLSTDLRAGDVTISKGSNVNAWFKSVITNAGCTPWLSPDLDANRTWSSSWVWEHGDSVLDALNRAASACGYRVEPDDYGRVAVVRYQAPTARSCTKSIPSGSSSIVKVGVSIQDDEPCNRVVVKASKSDKADLVAKATVADTHDWAFQKIGRWFTKSYTESNLDPYNQKTLQAKADTYLQANSDVITKYEVDMLYMPILPGEIVKFVYQDSPSDEGLNIRRAMVHDRDINLDAEMSMRVVLKEAN